MYVEVTNTDPSVPRWLREEFGGSLSVGVVQNERGKDRYIWQVGSLKALAVLRIIGPYLRQKRAQSEIAIRFQELTYRGMGHVDLAQRQDLFEQMKALNRKGKAMGNLAA